ncbi:unnamed protein product [Alternaria alternata]
MSQPQPEWNPSFNKWLITRWSDEYQRYYWDHHDGYSWVFFAWAPVVASPSAQPTSQSSYQTNAEIPGSLLPLDTGQLGYEVVRNPRNYFKIGRIFMVLWSEPDGTTGQPFTKQTRFVVVKPKREFCYCLRISTYSGRATLKPGVNSNEHAAVVRQGHQAVVYEGEIGLKEPIEIKLENEQIDVSPASRIDFGKIHPVQYNVKVKNVGRVVGESVRRLEQHLAEFLGWEVVLRQPTEYADATDTNEQLTTSQYAYQYQY